MREPSGPIRGRQRGRSGWYWEPVFAALTLAVAALSSAGIEGSAAALATRLDERQRDVERLVRAQQSRRDRVAVPGSEGPTVVTLPGTFPGRTMTLRDTAGARCFVLEPALVGARP